MLHIMLLIFTVLSVIGTALTFRLLNYLSQEKHMTIMTIIAMVRTDAVVITATSCMPLEQHFLLSFWK